MRYKATALMKQTIRRDWEVPLGVFEASSTEEAYKKANESDAAREAAKTDKHSGSIYEIVIEQIGIDMERVG